MTARSEFIRFHYETPIGSFTFEMTVIEMRGSEFGDEATPHFLDDVEYEVETEQ